MLARIRKHPVLSQLLRTECCENGVCVTISPDVDAAKVLILKVDDYFNSLKVEKRPKSVDCLVLRECIAANYGLTLVELKNIVSTNHITMEEIRDKFSNTLSLFIEQIFRAEFAYEFEEVKLYFVSRIEIHRRDLGLKMEAMMGVRIPFRGRKLMISPIMPMPAIKNCYSR